MTSKDWFVFCGFVKIDLLMAVGNLSCFTCEILWLFPYMTMIYYHSGWRELAMKLSLTSQKSFLLSAGHSQRHQTREHPAGPLTLTWTGNCGMSMWWSVNSPNILITFDCKQCIYYRSNFQLGLVLQFLSRFPYSNSTSWNHSELHRWLLVSTETATDSVKLADFGWANLLEEDQALKQMTPIVSPKHIQWLRPSVSK